MHIYTTRQAARQLGISLISLARYIAAKKVPAPKVQNFAGKFRAWSSRDIERVRNLLPKIRNGRKTRYAKKQLTIGSKQLAKAKRTTKSKSKTKRQPRAKSSVPQKKKK